MLMRSKPRCEMPKGKAVALPRPLLAWCGRSSSLALDHLSCFCCFFSLRLYYYDIRSWLQGDKGYPTPPSRGGIRAVSEEKKGGRNEDWDHLYNLDVISMPERLREDLLDPFGFLVRTSGSIPGMPLGHGALMLEGANRSKDLAFHCLPLALVDASFAKGQLRLLTTERQLIHLFSSS